MYEEEWGSKQVEVEMERKIIIAIIIIVIIINIGVIIILERWFPTPLRVPGVSSDALSLERMCAGNVPSCFSTSLSSSSSSSSLSQSWPMAVGWQGIAGRNVGPRYISSGSILGCSQRLASHLRSSARIGCLTRGPN